MKSYYFHSNSVIIIFLVICVIVKCYHIPAGTNHYVPTDATCKNEDVGKPLFLSPLIKAFKIRKAQHLSKIRPSIKNITSYSGFLTTNETCGNNLFFWFFPAQEDWEKAPLVLWLQGGPGGSSLYGLLEENGPFSYSPDGLKKRKYPWNVKNNLLYIDQPVGTGYSFTEKECYAEDQTAVGENLYSALIQFLQLFPNLQQNEFYITGESFAGHYIPAIGYTIHMKNPTAKLKMNLAGMMIGNGWMDPELQINYADYLYQHGLIDDNKWKELYALQKLFVKQVADKDWENAVNTQVEIDDSYHNRVSVYNYLKNSDEPHENDWYWFIQMPHIRKSLHVGNLTFEDSSVNDTKAFDHLNINNVQSVKPWVEILLEHGYPMVFYVGQLDIICAYPMVINFLRSLHWSGQEQYLNATRHEWLEGEDLAGYVKISKNFAEVLVRNAGHMVPMDQPFWAYQLVNKFISGGIQALIK